MGTVRYTIYERRGFSPLSQEILHLTYWIRNYIREKADIYPKRSIAKQLLVDIYRPSRVTSYLLSGLSLPLLFFLARSLHPTLHTTLTLRSLSRRLSLSLRRLSLRLLILDRRLTDLRSHVEPKYACQEYG